MARLPDNQTVEAPGQTLGPGTSPERQAPELAEGGQQNPIVGAFQTIATFIAAQQEKNNPQAAEMQNALRALIQVMASGAPETPGAPPRAPQTPQTPQAPQAPEGTRAIPQNAAPGAVKVL